MGNSTIRIDGRNVGAGEQVFVIAEVGINHGGSVLLAEELIKEAKRAGADAVKLQTYTTERRVTQESPVFEILKKCELSYKEQEDLFELGKELGMVIFSTPFDEEAVDFLESVDNPVYKIASFDSVNCELLRKVGTTRKPIIMSTGMTNEKELADAWTALGGHEDGTGCELALLHCISAYPTPEEHANLAVIPLLNRLHGGPVGYSDHTIGIDVPTLAVAAGAKLVEKHFTLDTKADGPDHALSSDPKTMTDMVSAIRRVEKIMGEARLEARAVENAILPFRRPSN